MTAGFHPPLARDQPGSQGTIPLAHTRMGHPETGEAPVVVIRGDDLIGAPRREIPFEMGTAHL